MKICMIGKFPPIQGGVSMRNYWTAHALAKRGHEVHLVTNAKEVEQPYRMFMRPEDWERCEADYGNGKLIVYWTEPYNRRQSHIPYDRSSVTKLASLALDVVKKHDIDVIYSFYTEPYTVAGHIVSQATGLPHIGRTAGSDAGRLWSHPQFAPLYDQIYRSLDAVVCGPAVAEKMKAAGVKPERLFFDPGTVKLSEIFGPDASPLDIDEMKRVVTTDGDRELQSLFRGRVQPVRSYVGIYGKLGRNKGTFQLLDALKLLVDAKCNVGLIAMAHLAVRRNDADEFNVAVRDRGLDDHVVQIPYLPHWRVPEFIRRCVAICCLEQDFPIVFHSPIVAREILTSGTCLIGAQEIVRKVRGAKLVHGRDCIVVEDVNKIDELANAIRTVIDNPSLAQEIGANGRRLALQMETNNVFPDVLEKLLASQIRLATVSAPRSDVAHLLRT